MKIFGQILYENVSGCIFEVLKRRRASHMKVTIHTADYNNGNTSVCCSLVASSECKLCWTDKFFIE